MLKLSFLGDISLNDDYIALGKRKVNPFAALEPLLSESDFVAGNLECMVAGQQGENLLKMPRLTTTPDTLDYLKNLHLSLAFLAQNHAYDHLEDGFRQTTAKLESLGIPWMGAGLTEARAERPYILEAEGIRIGFLNYVTADTNPNLPETAGVYLNLFEPEKCKAAIRQIRDETDHIVLSLHWGGKVEGGLFPDWPQPELAHQLIDAGADLIIGHHSHTLQPFEVYKGKYIFYSLGNFCFSDYWFNHELNRMTRRRKSCMIVSVSFNRENYSVDTNYFYNEIKGYTPLESYRQRMRFRNSAFRIISGYRIAWLAYYFHFKTILPLFVFLRRDDLTAGVKLKRLGKSFWRRLS
jgi:poly-gamma-glutamate capsule biosynthesis protein CapA/YwtB (metallophosphatase superfamily)